MLKKYKKKILKKYKNIDLLKKIKLCYKSKEYFWNIVEWMKNSVSSLFYNIIIYSFSFIINHLLIKIKYKI